MIESWELLKTLKALGYPNIERDPFWWPNAGCFEVVIGAILTQNTNWNNVEKALKNLREANLLSLETLCESDERFLAECIRPSGFYNQKAKRLLNLCNAIQENFGDFETFYSGVEREWLLTQKGVGQESADSILCYACLREEMVADAYTARILKAFDYTLESYEDIKAWLCEGLYGQEETLQSLYDEPIGMNQIMARFHGKIVEYGKEYSKNRQVDVTPIRQYLQN